MDADRILCRWVRSTLMLENFWASFQMVMLKKTTLRPMTTHTGPKKLQMRPCSVVSQQLWEGHARAHAHTHARTHAHAHTHTHTHAHKHTHARPHTYHDTHTRTFLRSRISHTGTCTGMFTKIEQSLGTVTYSDGKHGAPLICLA